MNNKNITVVIVDDHILFAEGTASLLSSEPDIQVVGIASTTKQCLAQIKTLRPDIVLLDINLPDGCGVDIIPHIRASAPQTRIIMLTGQNPAGYINSSFKLGAVSFLIKDCDKEEMLVAIRKAVKGETYTPKNLPVDNAASLHNAANRTTLTVREREVIRLLEQGLANKEIARRLSITQRTVEFHVGNIMDKLEVSSRLEAVARYKGYC